MVGPKGFDFFGWTSGNYPCKTDQASLFYEFPEDCFVSVRIDLTPREMGFLGIGRQGLKSFISQALREASEKLEDAKYSRNYR